MKYTFQQGKKLLIQFNSDDVIHSWWVPRLGRKMDMVPGLDNYLTLTVKKAGEYWGSCSEFCGTQHGWMRIRLIAHSPKGFERWQQEQLRPPVQLKDDLFESGQQLFASKTCVSCHSISPTSSLPDIGPNLAHFASRKYFLSNIKRNDKKNLREWLENPPKVKSGTKMPKLLLTDSEIEALAYYLENLK